MVRNIENSPEFRPSEEMEFSRQSQEVLEVANKIPLEYGESVKVCGLDYYIMFFDELDEDNLDAWYSTNSSVADIDVYIYEKLSDPEKRRRIFHEILEAAIIKELDDSGEFESDNYTYEDMKAKAHNLTLTEEVKHFGERQ